MVSAHCAKEISEDDLTELYTVSVKNTGKVLCFQYERFAPNKRVKK